MVNFVLLKERLQTPELFQVKSEIHHESTTFNTNWKSQLGLFYLIGIFGLSLFSFHTSLLDYTQLPRNACASFVFFCIAIYISIKSRSNNNNLLSPPIDLATGLLMSYVMWSMLSICWATNFSEAIFESQRAMLGFAAFYLCRWFQMNDDSFVVRMLKSIILISVPILLFACWQIIKMDPGIENPHYQISGICGHKNLFSILLFLLASFASLAFLRLTNNWRKAAAALFILILILALYLKTRSVYMGILCCVGIFLFGKLCQHLRPRLATILTKGLFALVAVGVVAFLYLLQTNQLIDLLHASRIDELWQSDTGYERLKLWEKTTCVIRQSPLWGVGAGNWQVEYPDCTVHGLYSVEMDLTTFQRPHNDWLWVWAETGFIGLIFYLGFFLSILRSSISNLSNEIYSPSRLATLVRISFIIGLMVISFFSFPKERIELILLTYTLMGLQYSPPSKQWMRTPYFAKFILVFIILSTSLNLFISYERIQGEKNTKEFLLLKQLQKWPEMIEASDKAISKWYTIDPTSIPIHWYRGTANFVLGQKELALKDFLKAEEYAPYNHYLKNDLGTCYTNMGQKKKARAYYNEAIRISPLFDDPRVNIGVSYFNDGEYSEALDWINSIRNHDLKMKYRKIIEAKKNSK